MQDLIITAQGKDLITKLVASATKATFTRVVTSSKKYTNAQASNLTTIENIQQSKTVDSVYITSNTKIIEAYVKFDNTLVTSGYNIQTVGVYAQETGGSEILYAVSLADSNVDYMPPYDGHNPTAITFRLNVRVENNANVEITIDATGSASNEALQAVKDSLTTTINSVNTTITNNLNSEISTRKSETSTLTTKLATETSERKGADTSLQANIDKEATARANADTAINNKLDPVKTLIDTVFLGEIVKDYDKGIENNNYKPVYFGTVHHSNVGLGTQGDGNTTWYKEAVKVLYTRLKNKGYKGAVYLWGFFLPSTYQWVIGSILLSTSSTYSEEASGYPTYCQFIALTYGGNTMYRFGMNDGTWYFETIPTTTQVNTLISNAKTALETAYKNADTTITNAYKAADTTLSNTLTTAYTNADTTNFNTLTTNYKNADTEVTNAYKAADQTNFNALTTNYKNADATLQTNINNEASTRASADSTLQTNIDTLTNRLNNISDVTNSKGILLPVVWKTTGTWKSGDALYASCWNIRQQIVDYLWGLNYKDGDNYCNRTFFSEAHITNICNCTVESIIHLFNKWETHHFRFGGLIPNCHATCYLINGTFQFTMDFEGYYDLSFHQSSATSGNTFGGILDAIRSIGPSKRGLSGRFADGPSSTQEYIYWWKGQFYTYGCTDHWFGINRVTVFASPYAISSVTSARQTYRRDIFNNSWCNSWSAYA